MLQSLSTWLHSTAITDPTERRLAPILQILLLAIICLVLLIFPVLLLSAPVLWRALLDGLSSVLLVLFCAIALVLLRRGHFRTAIFVTALGFMPGQAISLTTSGVDNSAVMLIFALPVALVGLLTRRRSLLIIVGISAITIFGSVLFSPYAQATFGFTPARVPVYLMAGVFCVILAVLGAFLDMFGSILREALTLSRTREQELEAVRASLEITVGERTAQLQQALQAVEQREAHLVRTLDELQTSQATIRELSAPIIPVLEGVLVAPLIGALDRERVMALTENVLRTVEQMRAHHVIFDLTGVPVVDADVAQAVIRTAAAVQLLGARALLVGIRPEVAQALVALSISFGFLNTFASLQEAIATLQTRQQQGNSQVMLPV
ncbi:MAG TPA: STAS domain-containing protein [Herpetosiphonaceae bacterium]